MIEETRNFDLLKAFSRDTKSWEATRCDGDPAPEEWEPDPYSRYFLMYDPDGKIRGFLMVSQWNNTTGEIHLTLISKYHGDVAVNKLLGEQVLSACFEATGFRKLVGFCPEFNKNIISFAQRVGMKREGVIKNACYRDGEPYSVVIVGVENE